MDVQHIAAPVAGKDYPRNWNEFLDWFASEEACLGYLERLRWPGGFVCPACGVADEPYRSSRSRLMCRSCSHQGSVTAGTIFDKTRTPLRVWLAAAWYVTNQKLGVSALGLKRVLGSGQLRDGLDDAASLSPSDGAPGARTAQGRGGSRRDLPGHLRPRQAVVQRGPQEQDEQDPRGHRRGDSPAQGLRSDPACAASTTTRMPAWCRSCRTTSSAVRGC